jgi:hypothetical protein
MGGNIRACKLKKNREKGKVKIKPDKMCGGTNGKYVGDVWYPLRQVEILGTLCYMSDKKKRGEVI